MAVSLMRRQLAVAVALLSLVVLTSAAPAPPVYDTVISNGRVMDPESGLDGIRYIGITEGRIVAISERSLAGRRTIDARGLVVAPGFIDLHSHAIDPAANVYQAHDGVTTALELEMGVYPVDKWYAQRAGKMVINYGASVSHTVARAAPILGQDLIDKSTDPVGDGLVSMETAEKLSQTTLTPEQNKEMADALQRGIDQGALGVGMAIAYIGAADKVEIYRGFEVAARNRMTVFVHPRSAGLLPPDSVDSLQELLADAFVTGAGLHICHIGSSGLKQAPMMIEMIEAARARGLDVTTEVYPYSAAMAVYGSPLLTGDWQERYGIGYGDLESVMTHQRLTRETFERGRAETPDDPIIVHLTPQSVLDHAVASPWVMIASDAVDVGRHPRTAGTFTRVLGRYVRERGALTLMQALAKMTILPARRLENSVPQMERKGRLKVGADADIVIFDPATVLDMATIEQPAQFSRGVVFLLVGGVSVIDDGRTVEKTFPGQAVRRTAAL